MGDMSASGPRAYEFDTFRVDAAKRVLLRSGEPVPLSPRIFDTLLYLVENVGRVLEKDELMRALWPDAFVEENNLNQNVSTLRRALGESRGENRYIVTVPGRGYRFVADVTIASGEALSPVTVAPKTVAVLPFKPVVETHRDEALELGMADTLIARLSGIRDVVVRPLSSVRRYAGLEQDAQAAGRALGVESVLDGSIQRWGDRLRVTARLVRVADGATLWVGTLDEMYTDVFAVQDAIAERVVAALALQLDAAERKGLTRRYTESAEAYDLYLKGRYHWNKLIPPEIATSISLFTRAIDADPTYALAYAGLQEAYRSLSMTSDVPSKDVLPLAKAAAARALVIDDSLADVHASLAFIKLWYDWDIAGAEADARLALTLDPSSAEAHRAYAQVLCVQRRHDEAVAEAALAKALDPLALLTSTLHGFVLHYARRDAEARSSLTKTLEIEPSFWIALLTLAKVDVVEGRYVDAVERLQRAREASRGASETISMAGYAWALAGDHTRARGALDELTALANERYIPPLNVAMVHNGLGDDDEAIAWLERAYEERDVRLVYVCVDPKWDRLREDPRFSLILERMGLGPVAS